VPVRDLRREAESVEVGDELPGDTADQRVDRDDTTVLHELLRRSLADPLLETDGTEDLHGALGRMGRARVNRGAAVILDGQRAHAMVSEQHGRGKPDKTSAHDENRQLDVCHALARQCCRGARP
jgi:hypothetical protein